MVTMALRVSSPRRARSASVVSTCSNRFFSRMTCWERSGFDHRFGSADCLSISASCGRTFSASKILPKFVDFLAEFFVVQHQLLIHGEASAFLRFCVLLVFENMKRASSAPIEIIAHPYANQSECRV